MTQPIIAIAEQNEGKLRKIAGEVCSEAVRLAARAGTQALGLTIGPGAAEAAASLGQFGIARACAIDGESVAGYCGETWSLALAEVVKQHGPGAVLLGETSFARDLLGRLGAHLSVSPASDCIEVILEGDEIRVRRPVYAGKAILTVKFETRPAVLSLRPNVFAVDAGQAVTTEVEDCPAPPAPERTTTLVERTAGQTGRVDLSEAEVIVAGGRGLKDPETFAALIEPLAEVLGAAVGASRAVVDAGWRPHAEQVGQTGKTVAPKLYFAFGISGAIQHLAGMRTSRTIVAVNKDPEAPIFKVADYGIVGDVEQVVPALTEQAKAMLAES
jgi:electron transfer flavoprotein alpha subunit